MMDGCSEYSDCTSCLASLSCLWCSDIDNDTFDGTCYDPSGVASKNGSCKRCEMGDCPVDRMVYPSYCDALPPSDMNTEDFVFYRLGYWPLIISISIFSVFLLSFLYCCCTHWRYKNKAQKKQQQQQQLATTPPPPPATVQQQLPAKPKLIKNNQPAGAAVVIPVYVQTSPRTQQMVALPQQVFAVHQPPPTATYRTAVQGQTLVQSPVLQPAQVAPPTYATFIQSPVLGPAAATTDMHHQAAVRAAQSPVLTYVQHPAFMAAPQPPPPQVAATTPPPQVAATPPPQSQPVQYTAPQSPHEAVQAAPSRASIAARSDTLNQTLAADLDEERRRNRELRDRVEWLSKLVRDEKH